MATQAQIEKTYEWIDSFHELRLGRYADFSCAFFDGNYEKTLERAQRDKHKWVFERLGIDGFGKRILDIGCGWGPILNAIRERGGTGVGLTLSRAQGNHCQSHGLDARVLDWKDADPHLLGSFDAVVSIGAFEHFCTPEEFERGEQERIYEKFFDFCADVLPIGGRVYLQTMIWGKRVPAPGELHLDAPEGTPERILARLLKFYPGSWAPRDKDQIIKSAEGRFRFLYSNNGRKDYIETLNRWGDCNRRLRSFPGIFNISKIFLTLGMRYLSDSDFRIQVSSIMHNDQQVCFVDEILTHERMFFEKVA